MSYDGTSGADVISSRFIEDGSYLRLGEVTLGYRLPHTFTARRPRRCAPLRLRPQPEDVDEVHRLQPGREQRRLRREHRQGIDYYAYPLARTFSVGVSAAW